MATTLQRCYMLGNAPASLSTPFLAKKTALSPPKSKQQQRRKLLESPGVRIARTNCTWSLEFSPRPISLRPPAPLTVGAQSQSASENVGTLIVVTEFKHVLLPIIDANPYLSESTRQAAATTTALAKKYGADITVVLIDHGGSEEVRFSPEGKDSHQLKLKNIRWHLAEGGFEDYTMVERLGGGQKPAAVIGELADDLGLDLVIMSMEAIHHKHIDGNLLAEFVPCPVLLLPL